MQALQESRVERFFITGLRSSPHHAKADGIPAKTFHVRYIGFVERCTRHASSSSQASIIDSVSAMLVTRNGWYVRRSFDNNVGAGQHNWRV
mmetsp:Transcript_82954/g.243232  ORF Transcript_82954/g.243232 Transcript_82954/m.243232 type:complete len:91 (+) Transcript_82954:18-290(+)